MRKWMLCLTAALLLFTSAAGAEGVIGLSYEDYMACYAENLDFINDNRGRHLLPLIPAKRDAGWGDGRLYHEIYGDVLSLVIRTEPVGKIIESCQITLTAPPNMTYGDSVYRDFSTSGFQSYGMLMAMSNAATPYERYLLVEELENGLATGGGVFRKQVGVYQLEATSENGTVTILFTNSTGNPTPSPVPRETPLPEATETPAPDSEA